MDARQSPPANSCIVRFGRRLRGERSGAHGVVEWRGARREVANDIGPGNADVVERLMQDDPPRKFAKDSVGVCLPLARLMPTVK